MTKMLKISQEHRTTSPKFSTQEVVMKILLGEGESCFAKDLSHPILTEVQARIELTNPY